MCPPPRYRCRRDGSKPAARMVRTTGLRDRRHRSAAAVRFARTIALWCLLGVAVVALTGCSAAGRTSGQASTEVTGTAQGHGLVIDVEITPEMRDSRPKPWVLDTPESAVRSYLDWMSYAYRVGDSSEGLPTRSGVQQVRLDAYIQYNLQEEGRLIDQKLVSIKFGTPTIEGDAATISAKEMWDYRHVSATEAGKELKGTQSISYDTTYTLVKTDEGTWVVDGVEPEAK